ncbi:MAG: endonuclease [Paludibacteraceae bacterium]|nr:endonuclease [Paludibacteraceae bacterium]
MKKHLFLLTLLSMSVMMWAEAIPVDYYNACDGKKDAALKTALSQTVKGGDRYRYGSNEYHTSTQIAKKDTVVWGVLYHKGDTICRPGDLEAYGTWQAFPVTDRRSDGSIWDMYSNTRRSFTNKRGESASNVEIEHCFPKSWWGAIENAAWCDLYHLNPSDKQANGNKSNFPPGEVQKGDKFDNGVFRMDKATSSKYGWCCFEPADCYKGDFARAYFYIVTAYEDLVWADVAKEYLDNDSYLEFKPWLTELLLKWHRLDPVSQKELDRADQISSIQHNRNPYIDYPELVEYIWGEKKGANVDFGKLQCTQDPSYTPKKENNLFEAYPAQDVCSDYFVASWNDFYAGEYKIDVYTKREIGTSGDTIISFPALTKNILNNDPHGFASDKMQSQGKSSILMGSNTTDAWLEIHDFTLNKPSQLVFRASQYATATAAQLDIFLNDHTKADTSITDIRRDEQIYVYNLPKNTTKVKILSVGGSTTKRACMQELYIIEDYAQEKLTYVTGYPQTIAQGVQTGLHLPVQPGAKLYYRVTAAGGWVSNEVPVTLGTKEKVYHLEVVVAPGAKGTASGSGDYAYNEEVTISATADPGHHFTMWSDGNKDNPRTIKVTEDLLLEAYFAEDGAKQAMVMVNYTQGQLKINNENVASGEVKSFDVGTTITLKAGTVTGYKFDGWSDGVQTMTHELKLTQDTVLSYTYSIRQYEIKTAVEGDKGGIVIGGGKYDYGSEVELIAVPDDGYQFVEWKEDHNTDNPRIVTVTNSGSQVYTAAFEVASALDHVSTTAMPKKMYINGRLYVVRGGQIFSVLGQLVHE